ncbi:DUF397 domain-containing protein [Streptomyces sp. NPDC020965]|uniref:DUF397 domain-containing protein n=1 Tax=Streptomyces sp. NPDC020965 TaxID=3365105 RepID=UPI0037B72C76
MSGLLHGITSSCADTGGGGTSGGGGAGAVRWRKSSHSASGAGQCVEVAAHARTVRVRDSKNACGPQLGLGPRAWTVFVAYAALQGD